MYVKLVASTSLTGVSIPISSVLKDVARMVTSSSPSLSLLTAFSQSASVLVDATPAGWSYVGSNIIADQGSISAGAGPLLSVSAAPIYCLSAPCANSSLLKYANLSQSSVVTSPTDGTSNGFVLTGSSSSSSNGVVTNEGPKYVTSNNNYLVNLSNYNFNPIAGAVFHLIASQRHITLIQEGRGIMGVWETSNTDAHTYYNVAPFIQFSHANTGTLSDILSNITVPTSSSSAVLVTGSFSATAFNTTNVATGILTGTVSVANIASGYNVTSLATASNTWKVSTINSVGSPKYLMSPVFFQDGARGYPTQFITGVVPIYWVKAGLGNTGDTVNVNGTDYTYFNSGAGFGVIMATGN